MTSDDAQLATWLAPSAEVTADPGAYDALRAEIDKLGHAHAAEPDWTRVEVLAARLLRAPRKDLRVATYVACARAAREGGAGVVVGMRLVAELLRLPSELVLPERRRARTLALSWYVAQTARSLDGLSADRQGDRSQIRAALDAFEAASADTLGDDAPVTTPLRAWLTAQPAPAGELAAGSRAATTAPSEAAAAPEVALTTPAERAMHLAALGRALVRNGRARFEVDATDAGAYRVRRLGAALCCERVPAANKRGRTELDPPHPAPRAAVAAAARDEAWEGLLAPCEALLDACPLWLEGHFLSARALLALGKRHVHAHAVVVHEARALAARLPGITTLCFADGSPLASAEARRWIEPPARAAERQRALESSDAALDALATRAARGEPEARVALAARHREAEGGSERFRIQCALAQALEEAERKSEAALMWRGLAHEAVAHQLACWQPDAALVVLRGLERAHTHPPPAEASMLAAELARRAPFVLLTEANLLTTSKGT